MFKGLSDSQTLNNGLQNSQYLNTAVARVWSFVAISQGLKYKYGVCATKKSTRKTRLQVIVWPTQHLCRMMLLCVAKFHAGSLARLLLKCNKTSYTNKPGQSDLAAHCLLYLTTCPTKKFTQNVIFFLQNCEVMSHRSVCFKFINPSVLLVLHCVHWLTATWSNMPRPSQYLKYVKRRDIFGLNALKVCWTSDQTQHHSWEI